MRELLDRLAEARNEPYAGDGPPRIRSFQLPEEYYQVVRMANGFVLRDGLFRFFGLRPCSGLPDVAAWNASPWLAEYRHLAQDLIFVAEDIFGDQYGFQDLGHGHSQFVKFWCEGGETANTPYAGLVEWLHNDVLVERPTSIDTALGRQARESGVAPSTSEHLAFRVPLIVGGTYGLENLEALDAQFHLNVLGQLSVKNRLLPEGTRIQRFLSES